MKPKDIIKIADEIVKFLKHKGLTETEILLVLDSAREEVEI